MDFFEKFASYINAHLQKKVRYLESLIDFFLNAFAFYGFKNFSVYGFDKERYTEKYTDLIFADVFLDVFEPVAVCSNNTPLEHDNLTDYAEGVMVRQECHGNITWP